MPLLFAYNLHTYIHIQNALVNKTVAGCPENKNIFPFSSACKHFDYINLNVASQADHLPEKQFVYIYKHMVVMSLFVTMTSLHII